ncbi:hypothetical protein JGU71_28095 [Antrihabitans sp. YC3-6]|uniref:Uncharacterized protein n=1 Tax=Antrihabitans stalagmiti TaxID=2799499 RepID=A0A934NWZ9_9NOCA|nr:hypothetical protein [Antrihabitans stalagmiti]MBJ8342757.1 hypothetical protein [Antrihabitans stalagmiti]
MTTWLIIAGILLVLIFTCKLAWKVGKASGFGEAGLPAPEKKQTRKPPSQI